MGTFYGDQITNYVDKDLIKKVQRKATKLVPSIKHLPYKERLWYLDYQH